MPRFLFMVLLRILALFLILLTAISVTGKELLPLGLLPFLLLLWISVEAIYCYRHKITVEPIVLGLIVANCGWWLLSVTWSVAPSATLVTYYLPVSFLAGYLLVSLWQACSRKFIEHADLVIIVFSTLSALYAIYQIVVGDAPNSLMANKNNHAALLNLVAFLVYFKLLDRYTLSKYKTIFSLVFVVISTAMFIVGSRGAVIAFVASLGFLFVLHREIARKEWLYLLGLPLLGFLFAALLGESHIVARVETLSDINEGLNSRFDIWRDSFALIDLPHLFGHGLGTFWMLFPQVRDPLNTAFYFFAHNDFLQIWIELGLIGLLLFVSLFLYISFRALQLLVVKELVYRDRLSVVTITAAIFSVLIHSLVTFNLYIPIILFFMGFLIARFQSIYIQYNQSGAVSITPSTIFSKSGYIILIISLLLVSSQFSATFSLSSLLMKEAHYDFAAGQVEKGFRKLNYSRSLSPSLDIFHRERAEILTIALRESWSDELFIMGQDSYNSCIDANRYRVACYVGLATLLQLHPESQDYHSRIEELYKKALYFDSANPRALTNFANFYMNQENLQSAYQVMKGTENYKMVRRDGEISYLITYIRLLEKLNLLEQAIPIKERLNAILLTLVKK